MFYAIVYKQSQSFYTFEGNNLQFMYLSTEGSSKAEQRVVVE